MTKVSGLRFNPSNAFCELQKVFFFLHPQKKKRLLRIAKGVFFFTPTKKSFKGKNTKRDLAGYPLTIPAEPLIHLLSNY
ncbi:hypothetical protein ACLI1A_11810 [Flavobacterium sp. RHBU_3]|uniref:hypothetical protein n=1 Tax=Flavobacterium sp. RHBU_3 TaxID=3391184 RepID=UPI003984B2F5